MTPKEAATKAYVTYSMVSYWARTSRLIRYPNPNTTRAASYLVDLAEVKRVARVGKLDERPAGNLISRNEAGDLLYVGSRVIGYYVKMGYLTPHYVFGNKKHYLVDRDEVLAQPKLMPDRIRHTARITELSEKAKQQPRAQGSRWSKRVEGES